MVLSAFAQTASLLSDRVKFTVGSSKAMRVTVTTLSQPCEEGKRNTFSPAAWKMAVSMFLYITPSVSAPAQQ